MTANFPRTGSATAFCGLILLAACSPARLSSATPPPPPAIANPEAVDFIRIDWISTATTEINATVSPAAPYTVRSERVFRSNDPRSYQISLLGETGYYGIGQLPSRERLAFLPENGRIAVLRPATRTMPWEEASPDATSDCRPQVDGYTATFFDDNQSPAIGIWRSLSGENYRVIVYAQDYACADSGIADDRFTTILTEAIPWRLAQVRPESGVPPMIQLLSGAEIGQPVHYALIRLARVTWRGE